MQPMRILAMVRMQPVAAPNREEMERTECLRSRLTTGSMVKRRTKNAQRQ
jgi:hypothetical protein